MKVGKKKAETVVGVWHIINQLETTECTNGELQASANVTFAELLRFCLQRCLKKKGTLRQQSFLSFNLMFSYCPLSLIHPSILPRLSYWWIIDIVLSNDSQNNGRCVIQKKQWAEVASSSVHNGVQSVPIGQFNCALTSRQRVITLVERNWHTNSLKLVSHWAANVGVKLKKQNCKKICKFPLGVTLNGTFAWTHCKCYLENAQKMITLTVELLWFLLYTGKLLWLFSGSILLTVSP